MVGGVVGQHVAPHSPTWRERFRRSGYLLLSKHPWLAGVHIAIESLRSGNPDFLALLEELGSEFPQGKTLSIAAFPPPTLWHLFPGVHWDRRYFPEAARRADQTELEMDHIERGLLKRDFGRKPELPGPS